MIKPDYVGKVRDVYDLGDKLLLVATDRLSAFDVVFAEKIPDKGKILNRLSHFWFTQSFLQDIVPNHFLEIDPELYPAPFLDHADELRDRSMLVAKARRIDFECVVRGYLAGSAWKEYRSAGTINGEPAPSGLVESSRMPSPIFTPATKASTGHDENVSYATMAAALGSLLAERLRDISVALYEAGAAHALSRGLILADTKFEFGLDASGEIVLIDEALTPDSSRYWFAERYEPGKPQDPFDKQFVRDYLETLVWNKQPPAPPLPERVIVGTAERYKESYRILTGTPFTDSQSRVSRPMAGMADMAGMAEMSGKMYAPDTRT